MKTVYVLQSVKDPTRYYIGRTNDVDTRLAEHNAGSSFHTAKFRPWKLTVSIQFVDGQRAFEFERYLKSGSGRVFAKRHF